MGATHPQMYCSNTCFFYSYIKLLKADTGLHFSSFRWSDSQLLAVMWVNTQNSNISRDCKRHVRSDKRTRELKKSGLEVLKWNLFTSGAVMFNSNSHKRKYCNFYKRWLHRYSIEGYITPRSAILLTINRGRKKKFAEFM